VKHQKVTSTSKIMVDAKNAIATSQKSQVNHHKNTLKLLLKHYKITTATSRNHNCNMGGEH